jgi:hypothetical protein
VVLGRGTDESMSLIALMHKEEGQWRVVSLPGELGADNLLFLSEGLAKPLSFLKAATCSDPAAARTAGEQFLTAWAGGQNAAMFNLVSPISALRAGDLPTFERRLRARPDEGISPVKDGATVRLEPMAGLTEWEVGQLARYLATLPELAGGSRMDPQVGPDVTDLGEFPGDPVSRGDLVPLRYRAGTQDYLMVLLKIQGKWKVVEPALPF